ncbi:MAG: hypothetical protein IT168_01655 [Bryobacterales bacterium]|nr:hypothetical protein [Bryobacterales bacterium]
MARRLEERLGALSVVRDNPFAPESASLLQRSLADKSHAVAAKAAKLIEDNEIQALVPDLVKAFERLLEAGAQGDPQCLAKNAIVKALKRLGYQDQELFLKGMRHFQREPVFGGSEDTAITLRSESALALTGCRELRDFDVLELLVDAWGDPEPVVRMEIARAISCLERREAVIVLKAKALAGDKDARVIGQCLQGILDCGGAQHLPFVIRFIDDTNEELRWEALGAMAATTAPEALDQLISWIAEAPITKAERALDALAPYRVKPIVATRVQQAVESRKHPALTRGWQRAFAR